MGFTINEIIFSVTDSGWKMNRNQENNQEKYIMNVHANKAEYKPIN